MPRKPEIGNVQLYPDRPLRRSEKNGYVLKFYCPLRRARIRKNAGTRDRREARRIQRECRERLLNGEYLASGGGIRKEDLPVDPPVPTADVVPDRGKSWQDAYDRYRENRATRIRATSLEDSLSRLQIAERIFEGYRQDHGLPEGLAVQECMTLDRLEYLQDRLLAGDECRYDRRSPNTVNSMMAAVMAFVRFCDGRGWISSVPPLEKLDVDEVMKGRPITEAEFQQMLDATPLVVGARAARSWQFALWVLWESGFRVGDLMDFCWNDRRHIHPVWSERPEVHSTIVVPSSQKNGRVQEIPLLPGLQRLLETVPETDRAGWVVNPLPLEYQITAAAEYMRPADSDLRSLARRHSNRAIGRACGVSDVTVRNWLLSAGIRREAEFPVEATKMSSAEIDSLRKRAGSRNSFDACRRASRLTKERVGRVISMIGEKAGVVVHDNDTRTGSREKFASSHDLRRGCAQRLINAGVSAETLKVIFRHSSFATTEKYYGAMRSAQAAASEAVEKLTRHASSDALVGGLMGGLEPALHLSLNELAKLKALLNSL